MTELSLTRSQLLGTALAFSAAVAHSTRKLIVKLTKRSVLLAQAAGMQ
jgi:hypothetical protein